MDNKEAYTPTHTKTQRVLAWIGIGLLVALTIADLILAITGAPTGLLMCGIVLTIFIPIILFFFIKMLKKKYPDNEDIKVPGEK